MDVEDLDTYGEPNDIAPDDPAPRAPEGDPHETTDQFKIWQFDTEESETVPDVYVVDRQPHPLDFRMWVFAGRGDRARFVMRASHKYGAKDVVQGAEDDCCEVLMDGHSLEDEHCPAAVRDVVAELTGATVDTPEEDPQKDRDGPINY